MKTRLTLSEKLKDLRTQKGLNLEQLAEETGISRSALGKYELESEPDIGAFNLKILCNYYGVSSDYLLGLTDNENLETGDYSELQLDDTTVSILKDGKFNHRLLSEIIKHPSFEKFLADIEIYVDGIATINANTFNAFVDLARQEILEKYHPGEDDYHMRVLEASTIDEYQYFLQLIQSDLGEIIKELRHNHAGEKETAPEISLVEYFKQSIEEAKKIKGSPAEKEFLVLCTKCGVNPSKVSEVEKTSVISFIKKSKKYHPFLH